MRDVADATCRVAMHGVDGEAYHISTPHTVSIRELVQHVCALTGTAFEELAEVSEERLGKDQAYLLDSGKVRVELGWSDKISLETGLKETLAWIDTHLNTLKTLPTDYIHKQ